MSNRERVVAIVQARMGSTRLPGKVLASIEGEPMLWHVIERARRARGVDAVVVATSTAPLDDAIDEFCQSHDIALFRGSESDVLDRYLRAATHYLAGNVVRITADCPLIDPQVIDRVVAEFLAQDCDYAANVIERTFPHGLDTEVFKYAALVKAAREATAPTEREHVTPHLRDSGRFSWHNVVTDVALVPGYYRWTVDEAGDLEFVRAVYRCLGTTQFFGWRTVVELLDAHPELTELNAMIVNDAGFIGEPARRPRIPSGRQNGNSNLST